MAKTKKPLPLLKDLYFEEDKMGTPGPYPMWIKAFRDILCRLAQGEKIESRDISGFVSQSNAIVIRRKLLARGIYALDNDKKYPKYILSEDAQQRAEDELALSFSESFERFFREVENLTDETREKLAVKLGKNLMRHPKSGGLLGKVLGNLIERKGDEPSS